MSYIPSVTPDYGYGYSSSGSAVASIVLTILAILFAIGGTVVLYLFVLPEKKRKNLPALLQKVHDLFNFKWLLLEMILKALYCFATLYVIFQGFFDLFLSNNGGDVLTAFLMMILGPIGVRITFELTMMLVLLVKNVISINNKLSGKADEAPAPAEADEADDVVPAEPIVAEPVVEVSAAAEVVATAVEEPVAPAVAPVVAPVAPVTPARVFCPNCGTPYDPDSLFCANCGTKKPQ